MSGITQKCRKLFATETSVQIYDNKQVILSRCKRIIEYGQTYIKVDMGKIVLEISGYDLSIDDNNTEGVTVSGRIDSVTFTSKEIRQEEKKE